MARPHGVLSRRRVSAAVAGVLLVTSGVLTAARADDTGIPPPPIYLPPGSHNNVYLDDGLQLYPVTSAAGKPKVQFNFPDPLSQRVYAASCNTLVPQNCPPDVHPDYPPTQFPGSTAKVTWLYVDGLVWVKSPPGVTPKFGVFPAIKVSALAFGSVPITATIYLSQTQTAGLVDPMHLRWLTSGTAVPPDASVTWNGKTYAPPGPDKNLRLVPEPELKGTLNLRIGDVTVDQVPLDVGPSCQTATPLQVNLSAAGGYVNLSTWKPGTPGEPGYSPYIPPSYLSDDHLVVPPFTGCHNGPEDLDPLLTGMLSGPNNSIHVTQIIKLTLWCRPKIPDADKDC